MPRSPKEKSVPFVPVHDDAEINKDPINKRCLALFDALRKRGVGPERSAYCVSQVHANSSNSGAHPKN